MENPAMTNEENYCFDIAGYLHIPGVLSADTLSQLNAAIDNSGQSTELLACPGVFKDPFRDLLVQPQLVWYLNQIVGPGFILDRQPELMPGAESADAPLTGGNEPRDPNTAYYYQNGRRFSQGVRVLWALEDIGADDGGFSLIPSTHKSNVPTPQSLATGQGDMGLTQQPTLQAGDLLIVALGALQGMRPWRRQPRRLLSYEFVGRGVIRSPGSGPQTQVETRPPWHTELNDAQRASLYRPGYQSTTPPPTLTTNGDTVELDSPQTVFHPSFLTVDSDSGIDHEEFYFWDLNGYLVLRGVMDEEWLAAANDTIDRFQDRIKVGEELARGSNSLAGTGRPLLGGLLELPAPYCDPFRRMVAHPAVEHRLNWMGASGGRMGGATGFVSVKGSTGHALHDANEPLNPGRGYVYQNGRSYCEAVTVTWQLRDVSEADGGFACVPGSHKAYYRMPPGVRSYDDHMGLVKHVGMKAGDVLFFGDGGTTHGALAWKGQQSRRGILIKYSSRNFNRSGGEMVQPDNRWGDLVEGMSDAQLAVMRGPDRDVFQHNVPRLDVAADGEVAVSYERGGSLYSNEAPKGPLGPKG
ncbi:MAG: hypothetical protein GKR89_28505 [Candidatus Latescibacteria bacterium]|nr:hypothetical protein [Candidatus Latescibacterota bacterium]